MNKQHQWNSWYFFVTVLLIVLLQNWWATTRNVEVIPRSIGDQQVGVRLLLDKETLTPDDFPALSPNKQ